MAEVIRGGPANAGRTDNKIGIATSYDVGQQHRLFVADVVR
ncbi:hypothetical protein OHA18_25605 [Kribbella sp. NBC_00709]|nr:hypothetical protein [Kribbella sp. NBC_00709]